MGLVVELALNYRLTDIHFALGVSQMAKLERFVDRRNDLAERYRTALDGLPLVLPPAAPEGTRHAYHLFAVQVDDRARVYEALAALGIGSQVRYPPIHLHPLYADPGLRPGSFPRAEGAYGHLLSIPLFPAFTDQEHSEVVDSLRSFMATAS